MTRHLQAIGVTLAFALASTVLAQTQEKEKAPTAVTPLKVQVVIARYQGDKKLSSMSSLKPTPPGNVIAPVVQSGPVIIMR